MASHFTTDGDEHLDRTTSAAICSAIGERLRRDLGPDDHVLPSGLQALMDEMERRDREGAHTR